MVQWCNGAGGIMVQWCNGAGGIMVYDHFCRRVRRDVV